MVSQSHFSLSWETHKSSICDGFTSLQQNGEFVDMTLAADGHYVKVHKILVALASPYVKELIASAPCSHPVIFLNNVSHNILCLLLEYIYCGEVQVPASSMSSFISAAKSLRIKGLESMVNVDSGAIKMEPFVAQMGDKDLGHVSGIKRVAVPTKDGVGQISLPAAARDVYVWKDKNDKNHDEKIALRESLHTTIDLKDDDESMDYTAIEDTNANDSDEWKSDEKPVASTSKSAVDLQKATTNFQFTVSIRGSLQVILNRYMYNLHSVVHSTGVRRWRCVDYRNNRCQAFVVTKGSLVLNRANLHNHPFHDKKILTKIEQKCVYSTLEDIESYQERKKTGSDESTDLNKTDNDDN